MPNAEQFARASSNVAAAGKHCLLLSTLSQDTLPPTSLQHRTAAAEASLVDSVPIKSPEQTFPVKCSPRPGLSVGNISTVDVVVGDSVVMIAVAVVVVVVGVAAAAGGAAGLTLSATRVSLLVSLLSPPITSRYALYSR
jgi:hypothetical protein